MPDINALLNAIKGQQQTVGNPAAQAAAGDKVTSMQNAPAPPVQAALAGNAEPDPHLLSAIAKIKQAHGVPLEEHESSMLGVPHQAQESIPYTPNHIKNAIEFGIQQGHNPLDVLTTIHSMLSHK
jgi:hypothetical protein